MPTVLLPVPPYKQVGAHNCLPACARMVLSYLGQEVSEVELALKNYWLLPGRIGNNSPVR